MTREEQVKAELKAELTELNELEPTTKSDLGIDCISRQAVLNINESHHGQMPNHINYQIWQEINELPPVSPARQEPCEDAISRKTAIDALWKALYDYEDKTEKQFQDSKELDIGDWIQHRIFVQNMSDIDRQTILNLPSISPARPKGKWIESAEEYYKAINEKGGGVNTDTPYFTDDIACPNCLKMFSVIDNETERFDFCPNCGSYNGGGEDDT